MKSSGLLGDTTERDYSRKLQLFNACAEPELGQAIASLGLRPGMRLLDAGCGAGDAPAWLRAEVAPEDLVVGIDLASAHAASARVAADSGTLIVQADLRKPPLARATFDLV